jgi:hypothetical protein
MPSVTHDGRSFMIDGRRVWLVSGAIHYSRVPREHWADRIHAAKLAGLNTVETPVFWNRHEPRAGQFDFSGDADLRHFIELIGQGGLYCILRPGPYVGAGWDLGGLPAWLRSGKDTPLRKSSGPLLEACSRYLTAVVDRVRDLQVTSPGTGGPIILVQNESAWTCGDSKVADAYLGELNRYLREAGITVPIINSNNLWQGAEGEIDCWTGSGDLLPTMRQFAAVRPDQPRLVVEFNFGAAATWGTPTPPPPDPTAVQSRLAQILAAGGQFNINPFHGGTNFGFCGGRSTAAPDAFLTASHDHQAPLSEAGLPGPLLPLMRRVCTFASRFGRVLANLDPAYHPVAVLPAAEDPGRSGVSIVHVTGSQGAVAFVFSGPAGGKPRPPIELLLPNGTSLSVPLSAQQRVSWCLLDVPLSGRARLDYCNLNAFALVGRVFVCFGPGGARGRLSVSGSPLEVPVPSGKDATIHEHEGVVIVVCNEEQVDRVFVTDDAVFLGVDTLAADGKPIGSSRHCTRVGGDGAVSTVVPSHVVRSSPKAALGAWTGIGMGDYTDGSSERFATIDGPTDLGELGSPFGLGWYRVRFKAASGGKVRILAPGSGDRLHVSLDGRMLGVMGVGPGATPDIALPLSKGTWTLVVLAENLGRVCAGADLGERKGLLSHVWGVKPFRAGRPVVQSGEPVDLLAWRSPLWEVHPGDLTSPDRLTWLLRHRRKTPLIIGIEALPARGVLLLNDSPIRFLERGSRHQVVLDEEALSRGTNSLQISLLQEPAIDGGPAVMSALQKEVAAAVSFSEGVACLSGKADWAFARWESPTEARFARAAREGARPVRNSGPTWWRARFDWGEGTEPLYFDATGLTKGQIHINGRHLCRYFVATASGKHVPPQTRYYIPSPWLKPGENTVLVFDEHGGDPSRCRLVHGP